MKRVTLTRGELEQVVYPAVAGVPVASDVQARLVGRVLVKLDQAVTYEDIKWEELAKNLLPMVKAKMDVTQLDLEDTEVECVVGQIRKYLTKTTAIMAVRAVELADRITSSPE